MKEKGRKTWTSKLTDVRFVFSYAKGSYTRNPTTALYFKQTYVIPAYPLSVKIQGLVW